MVLGLLKVVYENVVLLKLLDECVKILINYVEWVFFYILN